MPRKRSEPVLRLHKASGRAYATFDGRRIYLGDYGSAESRETFDKLLVRWLGNGRKLPEVDAPTVAASAVCVASEPPQHTTSVSELVLAFLDEKKETSRDAETGRVSSEYGCYRAAVEPLLRLFGAELAVDIGPKKLAVVRDLFIEKGLARTTINDQVRRIRSIWRWAVAQEIVPVDSYERLRALSGLRRGKSRAREPEKRRPVSRADVDAVLPCLSGPIRAMVEVMWWTGARVGEVVQMRMCDVDRSGPVWLFRPASHKTEHRGHDRVIPLGPRAQGVLGPFLRLDPEAFLFSPLRAESERNETRSAGRETRRWPSHEPARRRARRGRPRRYRDSYTADTVRRAITRACKRLSIPAWTPHMLRHAAATRLRCEIGLEAARAVLGHKSPDMTAHYAEIDLARAADAMVECG